MQDKNVKPHSILHAPEETESEKSKSPHALTILKHNHFLPADELDAQLHRGLPDAERVDFFGGEHRRQRAGCAGRAHAHAARDEGVLRGRHPGRGEHALDEDGR